MKRDERRVFFFPIHCPQITTPSLEQVRSERYQTQLYWSMRSCADLLHMLRWPARSRHAACSNSWIYVFFSTSWHFKAHSKFPWENKRSVFSGSVSNYLCMAANDCILPDDVRYFQMRANPAGTSDELSGIIISEFISKQRPGIQSSKTSTGVTSKSYNKTGKYYTKNLWSLAVLPSQDRSSETLKFC